MTEPKSVVLPLHHGVGSLLPAKYSRVVRFAKEEPARRFLVFLIFGRVSRFDGGPSDRDCEGQTLHFAG